MDKPQLRFHPCRTVVPLRIGAASRFLRCPHLLEQRRMVALCDPEDIVTAVVLKGVNGWRLGTEPIFGDKQLQMRVILAYLGVQALGGMPLSMLFLGAIVLD